MSDHFLTAALTCDACELVKSFAIVDESGEVNIDIALGNAADAGWVVTAYREQYTTTCAECIEWGANHG